MYTEQYILKMIRIGQSRVIYSDVEEPLGVVGADDVYAHIEANSITAQRLSYLVAVVVVVIIIFFIFYPKNDCEDIKHDAIKGSRDRLVSNTRLFD